MTNYLKTLSKTKFKVTGLNLENFLFKLSSSGIALSRVKKKDKTLYFTASAQNQKAIETIACEFELEVQILAKTGLISLVYKLPYSIGSILAIILSLTFLFYSTSFISSVEYVIPQNHTCKNNGECIFLEENLSQIKEYLSTEIVEGQRFAASTRELQNKVLSKFKLVEHCSIEKVGNTIKINLTEAEGKDTQNYTKIVAENHCIITSITTFSGRALVKAGDVVKKGQTLVEADGDVLPMADIKAKVFYTGMALHSANQKIVKATGKEYKTTSISIFDKTLLKDKPSPFTLHVSSQNISYITNLFLPIKKVTTTYKELEIVSEYVPFESVKEQALALAKKEALKKTNGSVEQCTYSLVTEGDTTRVDCYLEVIENVGIKQL